MQNQIQVFQNEEFGEIEVLVLNGKPYFPATECAALLAYKRPHGAISRHCRDSVKHGVIDKLGRTQEKIFIPEGDLYRLIIRSKLPAAVRFEAFVCDEVLPSIRQYGAYIIPEILEQMQESLKFSEDLLARLSKAYVQNERLMDYTETLIPKADYYDDILQSTEAMPISIIAKDYGMTAIEFNQMLHGLGVQYKIGGTWLLYKKHTSKGYTASKTYQLAGEIMVHTCWTQKGRQFLYDLLALEGIYPNGDFPIAQAMVA